MKLDSSVRRRIVEARDDIFARGGGAPYDNLEKHYSTFRMKFGPEVLASLEGRDLLNVMHDRRGKDCLMYWLEFKNDDEFQTSLFGGIGGGSALKFEIYQQQGSGQWMNKGKQNIPTPIDEQTAILVATRQRDQLLAGVEMLRGIPKVHDQDVYERLQSGIDERMPNIGHLAWTHKYMHLLFPELLDDYHSRNHQNHHLLKLLIHPPSKAGTFVSAWILVSLSRDLELPTPQFTHILNELHGSPMNYWRVGTLEGETGKHQWEMMFQGQYVAIGWNALGDLSDIGPKDREEMKRRFADAYTDVDPGDVGRNGNEIVRFLHVMKEGDTVLACDGDTVLGIGRVVGEYRYEDGNRFPHRRDIDWLVAGDWKMPKPEGLRAIVCQMNRHVNLLEVEKRLLQEDTPPTPKNRDNHLVLEGVPGQIQGALERKGQVILHGPPGTGKTYWAEQAANKLAARGWFNKNFEELEPDEHAALISGASSRRAVNMCCFHPAYGYEDFIEGFRPRTANGQMTFVLEDGLFKRLCRDAAGDPDRPYYLVIDEINRSDIPRVFGELLMGLEGDKRGKNVILPVSGDYLAVPRNLFVIGTMNTSDRSISLLDTALRRRFAFFELMPDSDVLGSAEAGDLPLGPWLDALNQKILEHAGRNARNLQIGHSYLMQDGRPLEKWNQFVKAVRQDIIPLLCEYFYENYTVLAQILGNALVDAEGQRIRWNLFEPGRKDELAGALKAIDDSIATSTEAIQADLDREQYGEDAADYGKDDPWP